MAKVTRKRNKRGFTLLETLVVVGMIVVLLGIGIPAVAAIQRSLQIRELDDVARQIFLSAQNELTTMKATGGLAQFDKALAADYSAQCLGLDATDGKPSDYPSDDNSWKDLYYLTSDNPATQTYLLGEGSVLQGYLSGGSFILEVNPGSGDVYGVFYAKRPDLSYQEIQDLPNRSRQVRKSVPLGYYGGFGDGSASSNLPASFSPALELVNREDLYLKVSCGDLRPFRGKPSALTLRVTVTDEAYVEGGTAHIWQSDYTGGSDFSLNAMGEFTKPILLDSMRPGARFSDITQGKLNAGDDLTITATLTYNNPDTPIEGSITLVNGVNSLFAKKELVGNQRTLSVGYLRHLNNLRYYTPAGSPLLVKQTSAIDFDAKNWKDGDLFPGEPLRNPLSTGFPAIQNTGLRGYDGGGLELLHFVFQSGTQTGLFGTVKDCAFRGVRLADCAAKGVNDVGLLAGSLTGGSITDCRAYLTTVDEYQRPRPDMDTRVGTYAVVGSANVGGLVGSTAGTVAVNGSFAAVNVSGASHVGGLIGSFTTGTLSDSYASGDVTATTGTAGGLVSFAANAVVSGCYATGDVTAPRYAGGLAGILNGTLTQCRAYGQVSTAPGKIDKQTSGPLLGGGRASVTDCAYLQQGSYNEGYENTTAGTSKIFASLKAKVPNSIENSHPYGMELVGNAFPFPPAGTSGKALPHYGDWPAELQLQTSLVYYEKYSNPGGRDTYGYYAKTSLTAAGGGDGGGDVGGGKANTWIVDTLEDRPCVEDGYAIMTIFSLTELTYQYNNSAPAHLDMVDSPEQAGKGKAALITSGASLVFQKDKLSYSISNAKVYQLPFDLQIAERSSTASFFDRVKMTGKVGAREVFKDFTFYYCPDFAKNAINPDPEGDNEQIPEDPRGEDNPVFVRSPRQLNGLGRSIYYWNEAQNDAALSFYFRQETDLDFGGYTNQYCGFPYDLMDTSATNPYRNKPIGRPFGLTGSQFRNIYDGGGKQIIDYCATTYPSDNDGIGYQFTGLFGEVRHCTLKDIHMVASRPGDGNTPSSGYVESQHNDSGGRNPGTGALVGLVYVDIASNDSYDSSVAQVLNCSVSGYDVRYTTASPYNKSATGGLVGYNFGHIENCTAVMKSVASTQTNKTQSRYIGGLVGSLNGKGTIERCYAAGTLKASAAGGAASCGGLCGGFNDIYGYGSGNSRLRSQEIRDCYSYCTFEQKSLNLSRNGNTAYAFSPMADKFAITNCYYLTDTVEKDVELKNTSSNKKPIATPCALGELSALALPGCGRADVAHSYPCSTHLENRSYPFPAVVTSGAAYCHYGDWPGVYPALPSAFLTYYEQYGDGSWGHQYVDPSTGGIVSALAGNEKTIAQAGYGILLQQGASASTPLPTLNHLPAAVGPVHSGGGCGTAAGGFYDLYPLTEEALSSLRPTDASCGVSVSFGYVMTDGTTIGAETTCKLHLNANFAATVSTTALSDQRPIQVRTAEQLQRMSGGKPGWQFQQTHSISADATTGLLENPGYTFNGGYQPGGEPSTVYGPSVGGAGNYIFGLKQPLFRSNSGTLQKVALINVDLSSPDNVAALALQNSGSITSCFATGRVAAIGNQAQAAGLVLNSSGTIDGAYFSGTATSSTGSAAGLVGQNNGGSITNCYTVGTVSAPGGTAAGLIQENSAAVKDSYSLTKVSGGSACGLGQTGGTYANCFWVKDPTLNAALSGGAGTAQTLAQMQNKQLGGAWTLDKAPGHSYSEHGSFYPYPRLSALDHYGDWPAATVKAGRVGAAVEWTILDISYYAKGQYTSLADAGSGTAFPGVSDWSTSKRFPLVLLEDTEKSANWTATYDGTVYPLTQYRKTLRNCPPGMTVYAIDGDIDLNHQDSLVLTDNTTGKQYSFTYTYAGSTFTYNPPA